jgi:type VI secretion system protein
MLIQERLLERLTSQEAPRLLAGRLTTSIVISSIVNHLIGLLNTRRGSVQIDRAYGMPDLSNIAGSFAVGYSEMIQAEVLDQVVRYEARLLSPQIAPVDETKEVITLKYELSGYVETDSDVRKPNRLSLFLRVNSAGRIAAEINHVS